MEFLISNKDVKNKFFFVKARRCGSNSLDAWLNQNIGRENYVNLSGDNEFINYSLLDIVESDILSDGYKVTFCRNPFTRVIAGYFADIYHITPSLGINVNDINHPIQSPQNPNDIKVGQSLPMTQYKLTDNKDIHIEAFTKFLDLIIEWQSKRKLTYHWQSEFGLVFEPLYHTVLNNDSSRIDFFDKIVHQENLNEEWGEVSERLIGTNIPFNTVNSFKDRHPRGIGTTSSYLYLLDYNGNREKIESHWKKDFELFGYLK